MILHSLKFVRRHCAVIQSGQDRSRFVVRFGQGRLLDSGTESNGG
jgi:hypothetical protein